MRVAVLGAGGAIGGHLVRALLDEGHHVTATDMKPCRAWWQWHDDANNVDCYDMARPGEAAYVIGGCDEVYNLACQMGGIGFIESEPWRCMNSTAINLSVLNACIGEKRPVRLFYSSSACIYPTTLQARPEFARHGLRESDAYPAQPEPGYGEEKLYGERLCETVHADDRNKVECRIARYHNVYSAPGSWDDGREKAPAAICRKVARAKIQGNDSIAVWGDGTQQRSYLDVSDAVAGTLAVMRSDCDRPLNVGSDRSVSVTQLIDIVSKIAGVKLTRAYDLSAPQGVAGRNADLTAVKQYTGWEPKVPLEDGLERLYAWVYDQCLSTA